MADEAEISVTHDELIERITRYNGQDQRRASDAGETRQAIGQFLEQSGVNNKAFAFARMVLKQKKETTQLDIIRSMELILPMIANHVRGQAPELSLDEAPEPVGDEDLDFGDDETEAFDEAVDKALLGEVVPFGDEAA